MNDEIKEILYLEKYIDKYKSDEKSIINGNRLTTPAMLDYLEVKDLLDYITNLQQENERLELLNDELELYNIIKKAVEYIEEMQVWCIEFDDYGVITDSLLNILRGEDK